MKKTQPGGAGSVADATVQDQPRESPAPSFRLIEATRVSYGSKAAELSIEIDGLGSLDLDYFRPVNGKPPFVASRSIRAKFGGAFVRTTHLEPEFAASICEAVEARLAADGDGDVLS